MRNLIAFLALLVGYTTLPTTVPPRVALAAPVDTVALYDSIYRVTATPYSTTGARSGTTTLAWRVHPAGVIAITTADKYNQQATIAGVGRGQAWAVASWTRTTAPKGVFADSVLVAVHRARVMTLRLFSNRDANGIPIWQQTLEVGQARCVYGLGLDRRGGIVTGAALHLTSTNPAAASIESSAACPDTTVDPAKLP